MAGQRDRRRAPRRQVLGVAGLTAVASGTTALVITMGSSQLISQELLTSPYVDGSTGGPVVVDQPRTPTAEKPRTETPAATGSANRPAGTGRAIGIAPVPPANRATAPVPGPIPAVPITLPAVPITVPVTLPAPADPTPAPGRPGQVLPGDPVPGWDGNGPGGDDSGDGSSGDGEIDLELPGIALPGIELPGLPVCKVDGEGMRLPEDVVRRLEQWLCGATGKPVVVIAKPLALVPPVVPPVKVTVPVTIPGTLHTPKHAAQRGSKATTSKRGTLAQGKGTTAAKRIRDWQRELDRMETAREERSHAGRDSGSRGHQSQGHQSQGHQSRGHGSRRHGDDRSGRPEQDRHDRGKHRAGHRNRTMVVQQSQLRESGSWYQGQHRLGR
jgi:hypothetical protein